MKLRNKETGEVITLIDHTFDSYDSLAELAEEWEDYEEPKDNNYWYIDDFGRIKFSSEVLDEIDGRPNNWMARKLFGNYFETKEEAEKAIEKLKAFKRLKDKGFKFSDVDWMHNCIRYGVDILTGQITFDPAKSELKEIKKDLTLLFGGEE